MKSCIEWRKGFKYLPEIDEFNIDYRNKQIKLLQFLDQYAKSQRVNIRLPKDYTEADIQLLNLIAEKGYRISVIFPNPNVFNQDVLVHSPFYFQKPCFTWDELIDVLSFGVKDVFISGELGFQLDKIKKLVEKDGVQIRCYANIVQTSGYGKTDGFKDFFIRPEDLDFYSEYIDVIEFYDSIDKQNVLYEIYFKDKHWDGKLKEIIKSMKNDINNYYLLGTEFARYRVSCGKECFKGGRCRICDRLESLADTLENSKEYEVFRRKV